MQADVMLSPTEAGKILGVSTNTVSRAAKKGKVGVRLASGKLVAVSFGDLRTIRETMCGEVGNPNWIAARGKGPRSRFR